MNNACVKIIISGRVQGVSFRKTAKEKAHQLSVSGFVRNTSDGKVEIFACSDPQNLDMFITWCNEGPSGAYVTGVEIEIVKSPQYFEGFEIQ